MEALHRYVKNRCGSGRRQQSADANFGDNVFLLNQFPSVTSFDEFVKLRKRNRPITWEEYEWVRDNMTLAKNVGLQLGRLCKAKYGNEALDDVSIRGVTANLGEIDIEEPEIGRYISDTDNEHRAEVTMIGADEEP